MAEKYEQTILSAIIEAFAYIVTVVILLCILVVAVGILIRLWNWAV